MRQFLRNNGLSLVLLALFLMTMLGQTWTGFRDYNDSRREHGQAELGFGRYLRSGHFWEATAENWESEFLQMAMFVVLTGCLFQKGSAESRDPDEDDSPLDRDPGLSRNDPDAPWPVRRGGLALWLYSNSLGIAFALLFLASFAIHAVGGAHRYNQDRQGHGQPPASLVQYVTGARFWFESFQNWQSEFLSLWTMVVFTIVLRQKGSPESKPVAAPHRTSGHDQPEKAESPVPQFA